MGRLDDIRTAAKEAVKIKQEQESEEKTEYVVSDEGKFYRAFSAAPTGEPPLHLVIFMKDRAVSPLYSTLYDVTFDYEDEFIGLVFPHCRIKFYGRNLRELATKLVSHTAEFIFEYDNRMTLAPDHDANKKAVITQIEMEGLVMEYDSAVGGTDA